MNEFSKKANLDKLNRILEEYKSKIDIHKRNTKPKFKYKSSVIRKVFKNRKPKVAILREQGVNGHYEMANAFAKSGFIAVDVTMNSIIDNEFSYPTFVSDSMESSFINLTLKIKSIS